MKEAKHKTVHTVWFHLYKGRLIYVVRSQNIIYFWEGSDRKGYEGDSGVLITFYFLIFVLVTYWSIIYFLKIHWSVILCALFGMMLYFKVYKKKSYDRASLVVQWLRICLPMQGTWVQALVREDPACRGTTKPVRHNYWACALEPASHNY